MKAGTRRLESSMSCPVVQFEIGSNDSAALSEFHATVFGWAFKAAGPAQAIVGGFDGGPSGMLNALGHPPEKYVMVYIEVPDLEACLERVNAACGATIVPPHVFNLSCPQLERAADESRRMSPCYSGP